MQAVAAGGEGVLGIFAPDELEYKLDRRDNSSQPSLAEMTSKAVQLLDTGNQVLLTVR